MKNKFESLLNLAKKNTVFSKIKSTKKVPFGRQKHLNSRFCSHFILLEKELEDALEPAEPLYSGLFGVAGVTRLELAASGVTVRSSIRVSLKFFT